MNRYRYRSPIARAFGLGSAKSGFRHWWAERVTAVALVPLTLWFAASLVAHSGSNYETFIGWLASPVTTTMMILLLISLFWHTALGLQVVIEDYVHSAAKSWLIMAVHFACFGFAATGIVATLQLLLR